MNAGQKKGIFSTNWCYYQTQGFNALQREEKKGGKGIIEKGQETWVPELVLPLTMCFLGQVFLLSGLQFFVGEMERLGETEWMGLHQSVSAPPLTPVWSKEIEVS